MGNKFVFYCLLFVAKTTCDSQMGMASHYTFPSLDECLSESQNRVEHRAPRFELPSCIKKWHDKDLRVSRDVLQSRVDYDLHFTWNEPKQRTNCIETSTTIPIINLHSRGWWPHFPHVAETYFFFVSTLLWQREVFSIVFNTSTSPLPSSVDGSSHSEIPFCLTSLSVFDQNALWAVANSSNYSSSISISSSRGGTGGAVKVTGGGPNEYIFQLFDAVESFYGIRTFQSMSCMNKTMQPLYERAPHFVRLAAKEGHSFPQELWPPTWFVHPSDAWMLGSIILGGGPEILDESEVCKYSNFFKDYPPKDSPSASDNSAVNNGGDKSSSSSSTTTNLSRGSTSHKNSNSNSHDNSNRSSSCSSHGGGGGLRILVVNRKGNREIENIEAVTTFLVNHNFNDCKTKLMQSIEEYCNNSRLRSEVKDTDEGTTTIENGIFVTLFDGLSLKQQVGLMRHTDVLITSHGAAETNIAFMRPCSVVIEVFPWAYKPAEYFGSLARSVDILYGEWQESYKNTVFYHSVLPIEEQSAAIQYCKKSMEMNLLKSGYDAKADYNESDTEHQGIIRKSNDFCRDYDDSCRECLQTVDCKSVIFDLKKLAVRLESLVGWQREQCMSHHYFYNIDNIDKMYPWSQHQHPPLHDGMLVGLLADSDVAHAANKQLFVLKNGKKNTFKNGDVLQAAGYQFDDAVYIKEHLLHRVQPGIEIQPGQYEEYKKPLFIK